jgi:hypothetical protein
MTKYEALGRFLREQRPAQVPMTFAEIEHITGTKLPPSAHKHRPWWSNNAKNSAMTKVWLEAGFQTEQVDMAGRKLVFRRIGNEERPQRTPPSTPAPQNPLRTKHHPLRGALKGLLRVMPGTDLTQPADPTWGRTWDKSRT